MSVPKGKEFNTPYPIPQPKAPEVLVRLGFQDIVVTKEEWENGEYQKPDSYTVGFEDQLGNECEEDGTYLNQTFTNEDKAS